MAKARRPLHVLLVEDDPSDIRIIKDVTAGLADISLHVVRDGDEALQFLRRSGRHEGAPEPGLVIMDLNMPRRDGRELLGELKSDGVLKHIPVVVLTTSNADTDLLQAYRLHASAVVTKPGELDGFVRAIKAIAEFWTSVASPPPPGRA